MARRPIVPRRQKQAAQTRDYALRYVEIGKIKPKNRTKKQQADFTYFKKTIGGASLKNAKTAREWADFRVCEVTAEAYAAGLPIPTEKISILRDRILTKYSAADVEQRRNERAEQYWEHIENGEPSETFIYQPVYAGMAA